MSIINLPYTFQPGTTIASAQVNADFAAILAVVNGNLDGTNFSTIFTSLNLSTTKGHGTFAGGLIVQWGAPTGIAADNSSPSTQTFDIAFPNNVIAVWCQIPINTQNRAQLVAAYPNNATTTNFVLNAMGGPAGTTVQVDWIAIGW
jgi:hypothetical protein